jgi:hypothetical protein
MMLRDMLGGDIARRPKINAETHENPRHSASRRVRHVGARGRAYLSRTK